MRLNNLKLFLINIQIFQVSIAIQNKLESLKIDWYQEYTICIVLCSKGYPDQYKNNSEINNLDKIDLKENEFIFHAGTISDKSKIFSNGGRVFNFVIRSKDLAFARNRAIELINKLNWSNGFFRKDIGFKVIK